ncbi:uncharacterized protein VTP21DRAFT_10117 [Calcarisporiella thermophila]|uniref:uncharacterized protein n=1 Tax=Calcarisporiella thermophila TaxID=911321 RepID=UPI0037427DCE
MRWKRFYELLLLFQLSTLARPQTFRRRHRHSRRRSSPLQLESRDIFDDIIFGPGKDKKEGKGEKGNDKEKIPKKDINDDDHFPDIDKEPGKNKKPPGGDVPEKNKEVGKDKDDGAKDKNQQGNPNPNPNPNPKPVTKPAPISSAIPPSSSASSSSSLLPPSTPLASSSAAKATSSSTPPVSTAVSSLSSSSLKPSATAEPFNTVAGTNVNTEVSQNMVIGLSVIGGLLLLIVAFIFYVRYRRRQAITAALIAKSAAEFGNANAISPKDEKAALASGLVNSSSPGGGQPIGTFTVIATYSPSLPDELDLQTGDQVRVLHEYDDGWVQAMNLTQGGLKGVCPKFCLDMHGSKPGAQRQSKRKSSRYSMYYGGN